VFLEALPDDGQDLLVGETGNGILDHRLLFGELVADVEEIHGIDGRHGMLRSIRSWSD
jgi:hypothetical protein